MLTPPFARLVTILLASLFPVIIGLTSLLPAHAAKGAGDRLLVHEWGTFTSVVGRDGRALVWRPLTFESDLPSFVYSIDRGNTWRGLRYPSKSGMPVRVRMETPVLYFYAQEEMAVAVKVGFPNGRITEWYPQARSVSRGNIDWGELKLMPRAQVELPRDSVENHYYPARETDAATVQTRSAAGLTEHEKFLFYRGVGNFDLPVSVRLEGESVVIRNVSGETDGQVVLFENRGGDVGYQIRDMPQTEATIARPALDGRLDGLRREMKAMLVSRGLYEKEAEAMLNTWRDSWFEEGLRVFYIMPRKTTDTILPIIINPQPSALVRVLVGRTEMITPEMEKNVTSQVTKLDDASLSVRTEALKEIRKYGRFLEPILTQILASATDPQIKTRVEKLLAEME
ncbi:MAG: hypothetical protein WCF57_10565 [Pyrinomonadaceae bacterium]